jgi:hypothetical protein
MKHNRVNLNCDDRFIEQLKDCLGDILGRLDELDGDIGSLKDRINRLEVD